MENKKSTNRRQVGSARYSARVLDQLRSINLWFWFSCLVTLGYGHTNFVSGRFAPLAYGNDERAIAPLVTGVGESTGAPIRLEKPPARPTNERDAPPNLIFILADDLGYGDLGCYGQKFIKTPRIDALAAGGLRFTDFYAGSTVCAPSRCSLMTGLHTGHAWIRGNGRKSLRHEDVTIAEVLREAGYFNGICGKWGLGMEDTVGIPTEQGFDYFFGYLDQGHAHNYYPTFLYENETRIQLSNVVPNESPFGEGKASEKNEYSHDLIMEKALEFIVEADDRPFFLYLALTIPHANNEAQLEGMEVPDYGEYQDLDWPDARKGHAAMISLMDRDVGRLVDHLEQLGLRENTIIFFSSDNGPHEEGGYKPEWNNSRGPLRGIKRSLHDGGIRVPMIINWPKRIARGRESSHVAAFWDIMPTLADLTGESPNLPLGIDGISFYHEIVNEPHLQTRHEALYWCFYEQGGGQALRMGPWKLVQQPYHSPPRLYNLENDLGEIRDVSKQNPEVVAQMVQIMTQQYIFNEHWQFPSLDEWETQQRIKKDVKKQIK
ncbi:MAG TPA: arylsulfatase [Pirellulaceae bacterium]|nr:arylsulfatase [Pirellulaceae bacterium]HMO90958.1 arylsulfatase [Pirellulaceae bacterium]HMP69856.1 arylsulfatase [Pirellulaceae bacterium]